MRTRKGIAPERARSAEEYERQWYSAVMATKKM
jgi:hypothetical protein